MFKIIEIKSNKMIVKLCNVSHKRWSQLQFQLVCKHSPHFTFECIDDDGGKTCRVFLPLDWYEKRTAIPNGNQMNCHCKRT